MAKLLLLGTACLLAATLSFGAEGTVGRVHVTTVREDDTARQELVSQRLAARFAAAAGHRFPDVRVISLRPRTDDLRFDATIYDYTVETPFELVLDADGKELERRAVAGQPARTIPEIEDAATIVREDPRFMDAIGSGALGLYEAMPPITVDREGRRLINVGVMSPPENGYTVERNEIVSVHIPTGTILRHASGAPDTARALTLACGPAPGGSCAASGTCSYYQISWPAADPVWKMKIRHPSCTSAAQPDGTGLEITDVYYRGRLILKRGDVPVLNVLYEGNTCGPYRDWLFGEDCFQATGVDVPSGGSGVRVATSTPSTFCESSVDEGNFKGVAIYDQGDALWLLSETNAGWYRYVMEWRFHLDGTIEPIFGFGATSNSCTCNAHHHHAYWRFEWAVDAVSDGTTDNPATGINTLERRRPGTSSVYDVIPTEGVFQRDPASSNKDVFRVKNPQTENGYQIEPGPLDGSASGDGYAIFDVAALALNPNEINDLNSDTRINISPWVDGEALGGSKRLVTWYRAGFDHDDPGGTGEACELAGPRLVPFVSCTGTLALDRGAYACQGSIGLSATDRDLEGTGTLNVQVSSGTEPASETVVLAESPAGSGRFVGSILVAQPPAAGGDGKLSVVDGDTISARYVDASACGTPNVSIEKAVPVDCLAPSITNLQAVPSSTTAAVTWTTNEGATSIVHYGTSVPTSGQTATTAMVTGHAVTLKNLLPCTTYYYWVESGDAAGNSTASSGYRAFVTGQVSDLSFANTTSVFIPDNNPTGATSTINVAQAALVQDVNVTVNITHGADGDLGLSLVTPTNATVSLSQNRGGTGNNFTATVFDDEAASPISSGAPPFTGSFRPETPLSLADGLSSSGNWRLKVVDGSSTDIGTLNSWNLKLTVPLGTCPATNPPAPATALNASSIAGGGVHLTWGAGTCPAPNYHLLYGSMAGLSTYAVSGGVCGLGPVGSFDWPALPAGDLWFVVVSDNAVTTEGSWGLASAGERNGTTASATCGFTQRNNAGTCP